jgi:hypothetical protein
MRLLASLVPIFTRKISTVFHDDEKLRTAHEVLFVEEKDRKGLSVCTTRVLTHSVQLRGGAAW